MTDKHDLNGDKLMKKFRSDFQVLFYKGRKTKYIALKQEIHVKLSSLLT